MFCKNQFITEGICPSHVFDAPTPHAVAYRHILNSSITNNKILELLWWLPQYVLRTPLYPDLAPKMDGMALISLGIIAPCRISSCTPNYDLVVEAHISMAWNSVDIHNWQSNSPGKVVVCLGFAPCWLLLLKWHLCSWKVTLIWLPTFLLK